MAKSSKSDKKAYDKRYVDGQEPWTMEYSVKERQSKNPEWSQWNAQRPTQRQRTYDKVNETDY